MCVSGACAFALQADVSSGRASVFGGRGAGSVSSSGQMGVPVDLAVYLNSFMSIPDIGIRLFSISVLLEPCDAAFDA